MKNICITKSNDKLNRNLPYYKKYISVYEINSSSSIYQSYYTMKENIDIFIFNLSMMTKEIVSFIKDFSDQKTCFVYIDISDNQKIKDVNLGDKVRYITKSHIDTDVEGIKLPNNVVNDLIYSQVNIAEKKNQAVYFLDNDNSIPNSLLPLLYPNTKIPIKMFNGENIQHYQHLGHLNETSRKNILLESSIMLYSDPCYNNEAQICGCNLVNLEKAKDCNSMSDLLSVSSNLTNSSYTSYSQFIKDFLL